MTEILTSPAAQGLWTCLVLAIASASVSITLTQTELFAPLRAVANKAGHMIGHMIGHLFHCFYCISHWVVIAGVAVYRPVIISSGVSVIDWTVSTFFTIALSALFCGMIFKVFLTAMNKKATEMQLRKSLAQS